MDLKSIVPEIVEEVVKALREQLKDGPLADEIAESVWSRIQTRMGAAPAGAAAPAAPSPAAVQAPEPEKADRPEAPAPKDEVPEEHLAVIFAALATVFGKPVKIRDIAIVQPGHTNLWGTQGRISIQRSHLRFSQDW
ncbi:MAG: hypothetical protein ACK41F_14300 [Fimbriimonadaceae bacterium]